jgi:hypothetical protein
MKRGKNLRPKPQTTTTTTTTSLALYKEIIIFIVFLLALC